MYEVRIVISPRLLRNKCILIGYSMKEISVEGVGEGTHPPPLFFDLDL
jgi:hypothetical protein